MYTLEGAEKTSRLRESFKGGTALFNLPTMPIKCGGAPQKILYLCDESWRKSKVRD
jgi:sulfide:quinone oxidoreductase